MSSLTADRASLATGEAFQLSVLLESWIVLPAGRCNFIGVNRSSLGFTVPV